MKKMPLIMIAMLGCLLPGLMTASMADSESSETEARIQRRAVVDDLMMVAISQNPEIQSAREKWRAVVETYRIETAYPDPQLMVTYFPDPIETRIGPQDWNAALSQGIPFPGKLSKMGDMVEAEARMARLTLDKTVRDVVVSVRESFYELLYIQKARDVAEQQIKLLDHLRKIAETAYAADRAAFIDVVKTQSQAGQLRYDVLLLTDLEETEIAKLNSLLNRPPDAEIGPLESIALQPVAVTLAEIYRLAEKNQEEIRMMEAQIQKADAGLSLARYQYLPNFKVGLFYAGIGDPDVMAPPRDAGDDALGVQFGVTIPLWPGKNKGRVEKAKAELAASQAAKSARINDSFAHIRATYFRLQNAARIIGLYEKDLLPQAAKSMSLAETWFQEGESSFSDFVETQSVWYNFQLALVRAQADYGKYLARLERLAGQSLTGADLSERTDRKEAK
ncbi:MAG: TolC family protein [Desulfobacterales bacterium]|jgi:outer membrane protein TolC|nr:TolC family protein [Desulfobacterales bacterium]